jgi:hemerythrin-like domain-containing protein
MYAHSTLGVIHDEHGVLSAMLRTIGLLLGEHRRRDTLPDFSMLRAMLFYVDEFPERLHHTKESQLLFPLIRERSNGELAQVLDQLDRDHSRSQQAVRDLQHQLLGLEMMNGAADCQSRRLHFEASMSEYIAAYLEHIHTEESLVLPLAERVLTAADWADLDAAFMQNHDPMTRSDADDPYQPLFKRILTTLPAPLGLGAALESMAKAS